ncbi:DNA methyltransferase [Mycobacteroides abscessus]|nr:DNA methyltransferase [Mycobacteroides abscessus]
MSKRWFGRKHDVLLLYVKDDRKHTFNLIKEKSYITHKYGFKNVQIYQEPAPDNRLYTMVGMRDVWAIDALRGNQPETLGYPTQKPLALLERVVAASSNEGDIVLDPFCGCGTSVDAAQRMNRSWIGIDIAYTAIDLIEKRLKHTYAKEPAPIETTYKVEGIPKDIGAAHDLFERSHFEFERWVVALLDATPKPRPGRDKGVDGLRQFYLDAKGQLGSVIISVKGGAYGPTDIRDLGGTLDAQGAQMGILVSLKPSTRGVRDAVDHGGTYTHPATGEVFPRLQHVTVDELLRHELPRIPLSSPGYIQAAKLAEEPIEESTLFD